MTCYTRHLKDIMKELGMEDTKENRRILDKRLRAILGREDDHCPEVWRDVKERLHDPKLKERMVEELRGSKEIPN